MTDLPLLLAGPIIRRFDESQLNLWLVTSQAVTFEVDCFSNQTELITDHQFTELAMGKRAYTYLIRIGFEQPLEAGQQISYNLRLNCDSQSIDIGEQHPKLRYDNEDRLTLSFQPKLRSILHGSCRKPHHPGVDALLAADRKLNQLSTADRPALLIMSGDQIYADDVAGPMLNAIHQVIQLLELPDEKLHGAIVDKASDLYQHPDCYYARESLLPDDKPASAVVKRLFGGVRKPIFTSDSAHNHLITFAEVFAMYLLVWSPNLWPYINIEEPVNDEHAELYNKERLAIEQFRESLGNVQRLLAHIPSYMMFDDHDVTDDWNLTRGWEETAYSNPFAKQMLGNALIGYWLCQGWGNNPDAFDETFISQAKAALTTMQSDKHQQLITTIQHFDRWHYSLPTSPKLIALDTRTHRWRSESDPNKPSGLMDWEALSELQNELIGEDAVLLISPAPIFGVKLIEAIQRIFTYFGKPLLVDAENWMAHPGSANVILNIFQHPKTPQHFIILSGDVHYSFAYDIRLRSRRSSPDIWQITCSGIKNEFPEKLIRWFDRLNTALYGFSSPLNWFTKRRRMRLRSRRLSSNIKQRLNLGNAIGYLELSADCKPEKISAWMSDGKEVDFIRKT